MLRYIYGHDLHNHADLAHSMFRDRADQFQARLGWEVQVDCKGEERDRYDQLDPLYVIWEMPDGSHGGSMRFLPTTGPVMVNDVFLDLAGGVPICSPLIWECTRFCLSRDAGGNVAGALTLGGVEIMRNFSVAHFAGVFDRRMVRIYRSLGFSPDIIGTQGEGRERICLGLWEYTPEVYLNVASKAGIAPDLSQLWFDRSFGSAGAAVPMALTG
ncbi:autoinducer synthase [Leisingera sp. M527]|uniref:acyl-homoserine-lactone synthase n=1 Tax=unclassified Leisingera TaxID=2614906 RepID=UPI0021A2967D|nr:MULTISPECIES: acyl-homoserine-lactone synthase [unclassified Leisingera]UWQ27907.1 autoinducer synthase [Leisingera sp. M523]UWQ33656.1 autoinducer synthase [Leisingera sp. M527]